jgi:predicted nuclease of restriction endonuclease-like RecB superfamily
VLRPAYLTVADYPWLYRLLDEVQRLVGQRRGAVSRRLAEPMPFEAPKPKLAAAVAQILRGIEEAPVGEPHPAELRAALFEAAASLRHGVTAQPPLGSAAFRAAAVAAVNAQTLGALDGDVKQLLMQRLYADIPSERIVARFPEGTTPASLAVAANGAMVARQLKRADVVTIDLLGEARRVVRQAKLRGLLCTVTRTDLGARLSVSGPMAVIRRTTYYGRALAELVPFLAWCPRFVMTAHCSGTSGSYRMRVESGDPLPPAPSKPSFDSQLEQRFARAFGKATGAWDLIREPEPLAVPASDGTTRLVFPDFAAVQRTDPSNRWLIEIVGFWTPSYLAAKLDGLRAVCPDRLVLCVDERLACEASALEDFPALLRFKGRVPADEVLRMINRSRENP